LLILTMQCLKVNKIPEDGVLSPIGAM
jgi:hypothetical protein